MTGPLFLVGFMGSGKSAVGSRVAEELGLPFSDCDALIAAAAGRSVERIIRQDGEAAFREREALLMDQLCSGGPLIAATGGGAFLLFRSRKRMIASGITVWLDTPLPLIRKRLAVGLPERPLWDPEDPVGMRQLYEGRLPAYALAGHRVESTGLDAAVQQVIRISRQR